MELITHKECLTPLFQPLPRHNGKVNEFCEIKCLLVPLSQLIHMSLRLQGVGESKVSKCFLLAQARFWNDLPCAVFDSGRLSGLQGTVKR